MRWLIDFDDTLAIGYMTWAMEHVIPQMIEEFALPYEEETFSRALLHAQKQSNENTDDQRVVNEFFDAIGWDYTYQGVLMQRVYAEGYALQLYPDTEAFLQRLSSDPVNRIFVVSNNPKAPELAAHLGITAYFEAILTPEICGSQAKPVADMYAYLDAHYPDTGESVMVGDDPWSDGTFAKTCGMTCWLLDRMDRYAVLYPQEPYRWVKSLDLIGTV